MSGCRVCRSRQLQLVTDFGPLAITNHFLADSDSSAYRQPISWQECLQCGVVQLSDVPPVAAIQPRYSWIQYAEPEGHLDETVRILMDVASINSSDLVVGFSKDDGPLLKRLPIGRTRQLDVVQDLNLTPQIHGMGMLQSVWTTTCAREIVKRSGPADVLVARYALEHCHDAAEFLAASREVLSPDGVLLIEVPDSAAAFRSVDVTVVWEEHTLYFTEQTLIRGLSLAGFETRHLQRVPDVFEDRLVWIGSPSRSPDASALTAMSGIPDPDVHRFAETWPQQRDRLRQWASEIVGHGGRLAIFGAGHRACTLVDVMGLAEFLDCVIDDSPEKQQLFFPAGGIPIRGSRALVDREITCCLMVVNPTVEEKIVNRNMTYVEKGGQFVSLHSHSPRVLRLL